MNKSSLLFLSDLTPGFASLVKHKKRTQLIGGDYKKGPPGIKTFF